MNTDIASFIENLNALISEVAAFQNLVRSHSLGLLKIKEADREKVHAAKLKVMQQYSELLREKEDAEREAREFHGTL